jgi:hypothetical protein
VNFKKSIGLIIVFPLALWSQNSSFRDRPPLELQVTLEEIDRLEKEVPEPLDRTTFNQLSVHLHRLMNREDLVVFIQESINEPLFDFANYDTALAFIIGRSLKAGTVKPDEIDDYFHLENWLSGDMLTYVGSHSSNNVNGAEFLKIIMHFFENDRINQTYSRLVENIPPGRIKNFIEKPFLEGIGARWDSFLGIQADSIDVVYERFKNTLQEFTTTGSNSYVSSGWANPHMAMRDLIYRLEVVKMAEPEVLPDPDDGLMVLASEFLDRVLQKGNEGTGEVRLISTSGNVRDLKLPVAIENATNYALWKILATLSNHFNVREPNMSWEIYFPNNTESIQRYETALARGELKEFFLQNYRYQFLFEFPYSEKIKSYVNMTFGMGNIRPKFLTVLDEDEKHFYLTIRYKDGHPCLLEIF